MNFDEVTAVVCGEAVLAGIDGDAVEHVWGHLGKGMATNEAPWAYALGAADVKLQNLAVAPVDEVPSRVMQIRATLAFGSSVTRLKRAGVL